MGQSVCKRCRIVWVTNKTHSLCSVCNKVRLQENRSLKNISEPEIKTIVQRTSSKRYSQLSLDRETFHEVFLSQLHICQECGAELPTTFTNSDGSINSISQYSHNLSKGAYPEYRNKSWNITRLCLRCHQRWEWQDRKNMRIYPIVKALILEKTKMDLL